MWFRDMGCYTLALVRGDAIEKKAQKNICHSAPKISLRSLELDPPLPPLPTDLAARPLPALTARPLPLPLA
jgi:hypothetical protein